MRDVDSGQARVEKPTEVTIIIIVTRCVVVIIEPIKCIT